MALPNYKEIIDLVKVGSTIEAQEKIMQLRQSALDLQEENIELRNKITDLEAKLREAESADGDLCPRCRKRTYYVESSEPDRIFGDLGAPTAKLVGASAAVRL